MIKHILAIIILTLLIVFGLPFCFNAMQYFYNFYAWIIDLLNNVFAGGQLATFIKQVLTILIISFGLSGIVAGIYWGFKRSHFPYFTHLCWIVWIILITSIVWQHAV